MGLLPAVGAALITAKSLRGYHKVHTIGHALLLLIFKHWDGLWDGSLLIQTQ